MKYLLLLLAFIVVAFDHEEFGDNDSSRPNLPSQPKYWNILKET